MFIGLHLKYLLFLSGFNENYIFSGRFSKDTRISIFIKINPLPVKLSHADGWT